MWLFPEDQKVLLKAHAGPSRQISRRRAAAGVPGALQRRLGAGTPRARGTDGHEAALPRLLKTSVDGPKLPKPS